MHDYKDSLFRIFRPDIREALKTFYANRQNRITPDIANELVESNILDQLIGLQLIEYDNSEYRIDDRFERFLDEMLGASEAVHADWLSSFLDDLSRLIDGHRNLKDTTKGDALLRRIHRLLRTCHSRVLRHIEDIKTSVDYDYRAGSDYELKQMNLQWHLERAENFGNSVAALNDLLRHDTFFHIHQDVNLLSLRSRLIQACSKVGDALIDVYQSIEDYLNRIMLEYNRVRKLIHLRGLIERHEHLTSTNLLELAELADGPWFLDSDARTMINPTILDSEPELLQRALRRAGIGDSERKAKKVKLTAHPASDLLPVIDWSNVYDAFTKQQEDLYVFLSTVLIEGRLLTEEERIDGYCAILSNEDWIGYFDSHPFPEAIHEGWQYAVVKPPIKELYET